MSAAGIREPGGLDVVGLGNALVDVLSHESDEFVESHGLVKGSMALIDAEQSERLYAALKGHGATVRYVTLPHEAHGYAARETLLHVIAERLNWFDKYVKNAGARSTTDAQR